MFHMYCVVTFICVMEMLLTHLEERKNVTMCGSVLQSFLRLLFEVIRTTAATGITGFIQSYFLHKETEKIGVLCSGLTDKSTNTLDQEAFTDETCYIYRLKHEPSVVFCQCNTKVSPQHSYSWVQQVCRVIPLLLQLCNL